MCLGSRKNTAGKLQIFRLLPLKKGYFKEGSTELLATTYVFPTVEVNNELCGFAGQRCFDVSLCSGNGL